MNELLVKIGLLIPSLSRAERVFTQALLGNPEAIIHLTLADIARESDSSDASIIRLCKRLGYHGYSGLKQASTATIAKGDEAHEEEIEESDDVNDTSKKISQSNVQTLQNTIVLANERCRDALDALTDTKSIHSFGMGDVFAACQLAFIEFCRLGIPCSSYSDVMLQYVTADNLGPGNVALAVSYGGRSRNVVQIMRIAKEQGATIISTTKMNKPPLLRYTDIPSFTFVSNLTVSGDKATWCVADQLILDVLRLKHVTGKKQDFSRRFKKAQGTVDCNRITQKNKRCIV